MNYCVHYTVLFQFVCNKLCIYKSSFDGCVEYTV